MNKKVMIFLVLFFFSGKIFSITEDDEKVIKAAQDGDLNTITSIWENSAAKHAAFLDAQDNQGKTALFYAAGKKEKNYIEIVEYL